jgi:hypothetical protein
MCDNPRDKRTIDDVVHGNCRTGETDCEDCRSRPLEDVITSHFTLCQKPYVLSCGNHLRGGKKSRNSPVFVLFLSWWCLPQDADRIQERRRRKLHRQWYRIRSDLEKSWGRSGMGPGTFDTEQFHGYCKQHGKHGYIPIARPFGENVEY